MEFNDNKMFFERKKRLTDSAFFDGFTDYHCHILFGVDDGLKELSESLKTLSYYESLGVKKVYLTPHVNLTYNDWNIIETNFSTLKNRYKGAIELQLAAEYLLDSGFVVQMKQGLRCMENNRVLVESSYFNKSTGFDETLFLIANEGYTPIIAHPERYLFMNRDNYQELKNCDYLFQLNLLSLSGMYGGQVKHRALYLLEKNMYDLIGSDMHDLKIFKEHIPEIKLSKKQFLNLMSILK
ncbi:tyrosine-protein phosphatase [Bacteroides ovatus]|uniref:tyrosine-protein phosphatase n=1 Tax=Bacteroides ovatus TaxID=28116 RepID=UPI002109619B|nr:CpsB/CapC family capsule biosynthesis tyrosine phosphatase [Bacteroides ovatus]